MFIASPFWHGRSASISVCAYQIGSSCSDVDINGHVRVGSVIAEVVQPFIWLL